MYVMQAPSVRRTQSAASWLSVIASIKTVYFKLMFNEDDELSTTQGSG